MEVQTPFFADSARTLDPKYTSTRRLFTIMVVVIFLAEIVAMTVIYYTKIGPYWAETLLDATIMVILTLPMIYYLHFRVLVRHIADKNRSEALLTRVLENLPVGVWITDKNGRLLHGNPASQAIWAGARYVDMQEYGEYKAWWLDSGKRVEVDEWAAARAIQSGESSLNEEMEIECFDGTHKIILNSAVPFSENGSLQGVIVVNQDITERKKAEQELRKSEAVFKTAFQILPVGAWITDETGKIVYGNPAGHAIWEGARFVGPEEFKVYKAWWLATGKPIEPEEWAIARAIKNGETSLNEEIEIECFDGTHKIILNSAIPVRDEEQHFHGVFVVNQDITLRKKYEQDLIHSNELIERAFNSIDIMIAYMDRQFNFIRVNEAYASSAGHPVDYFTDKNHFALYPHAENQTIFQRVIDTGEPYSVFEKPFENPEFPEQGATYWNWRLQPVIGGGEEVQGVVLSLVDVTERKLAELKLERQRNELQALSISEHKQRQLAETLNAVSLALSQTLSLETVMDTLMDYARRLVPAQLAYILIAENESDLTLRAMQVPDAEESLTLITDGTFDAREIPCLQEVLSTKKSLLIRDTQDYPGWTPFFTREIIRNWMGIPMLTSGNTIGVLALADTRPDFFEAEHVRLAEAIVAQAAVAMQNAWLFEQVRAGHERLQSLSRRLVEVQESERRYIARELHDEASQSLTALMFGLSLLEQEAARPENLQKRVAELKKLTDGVLEDLHRLAIGLRPASLDYLGLVPALEQLVQTSAERYPMNFRFKTIGIAQEDRLPDYVETSLYRIVQEALTNAVRYAKAKNIDVILELREGKVLVMVEDDGVGFETAEMHQSGHLGLMGIQERVQMLSGTFEIETSLGCGTTVVVEVPYVDSNTDRR